MRIVTKTEFIAVLAKMPEAVMSRTERGHAWTVDGKRMAQTVVLPTGAKQYRIEDVPFTHRRTGRQRGQEARSGSQ